MNMAIDESILKSKTDHLVPSTVRFYRWEPSAVSIGRFQDAEKETHLANCRKHGIDVVRRITGGGAVYHDSADEITYSVIADRDDLGTEDIADIYAKIYSGLTKALAILGVNADFNQGSVKACPNLTVRGRKISGSAQAHRHGVVLQHGTLLTKVNLERMFRFLRVPWAQTCFQVVRVAESRITSISSETGRDSSDDEIINALVRGFESGLDIKMKNGRLTPKELESAEDLCETKYATDAWNLRSCSSLQEQ